MENAKPTRAISELKRTIIQQTMTTECAKRQHRLTALTTHITLIRPQSWKSALMIRKRLQESILLSICGKLTKTETQQARPNIMCS